MSLFQVGQGSVFEGFPNILAVFTKVFYAFRLAFRRSVVDPSDRVGLRFGDVGVPMHAAVRLDWGGDGDFEVEFWLLHVSVPSAIWWQWTGGLQPVTMADRVPILLAAMIWLLVCWRIGRLIARTDPVTSRLSKYERIGVSILIGQSALSVTVFVYGSLIGIHSLVWLFSSGFIISFILWLYRVYTSGDRSLTESSSKRPLDSRPDVSFATSISRRMVGLLVLAITFLAFIHIYGATIPPTNLSVPTEQVVQFSHRTCHRHAIKVADLVPNSRIDL